MNAIKNKKGFTLVEVIAVLVILAILIAIAVPAVNGYIERTKDTEYDLVARNVYMAATVAAADYLAGHTGTETDTYCTTDDSAETEGYLHDIAELSSIDLASLAIGTAAGDAAGEYTIGYASGVITVYYLDGTGTATTYPATAE